MGMSRFGCNFGLVMAGILLSGAAWGAQGLSGLTSITDTLQQDDVYGGCMARISPAPSTITTSSGAALNCTGDRFVTFDCEGKYGSKSGGNSRFNTAVAALITERKVQVLVSDTPKINGFCRVVRIDLK